MQAEKNHNMTKTHQHQNATPRKFLFNPNPFSCFSFLLLISNPFFLILLISNFFFLPRRANPPRKVNSNPNVKFLIVGIIVHIKKFYSSAFFGIA